MRFKPGIRSATASPGIILRRRNSVTRHGSSHAHIAYQGTFCDSWSSMRRCHRFTIFKPFYPELFFREKRYEYDTSIKRIVFGTDGQKRSILPCDHVCLWKMWRCTILDLSASITASPLHAHISNHHEGNAFAVTGEKTPSRLIGFFCIWLDNCFSLSILSASFNL